MKQWEPSLFFRVCRFVLRVQIILGLTIFCYRFFYGFWGVVILLYFGWLIGLAGFVFFILGLYHLMKEGGAEKGESFLLTTVLVDSGIYSVVRHPEYLGSIMLILGSILVSQNLLTLLLGFPLLAWFVIYVLPVEDKDLLEKFGESYESYMKEVPSINFVVGVIRVLRYRKSGQVDE